MRIAGRALELIPLDFAPCARVPRDPDEEFDMSSAIARSQSHTVTLPAALDFNVAATLSRTLDNCRGEDVVIDASYVQKLGAQCFQVLHAAEQAWKADNRLFTLVNGPARFLEELSGGGADPSFA
jgi:chemotaxis protein CheX